MQIKYDKRICVDCGVVFRKLRSRIGGAPRCSSCLKKATAKWLGDKPLGKYEHDLAKPDDIAETECLNCGAPLEGGWCSEHCQDKENSDGGDND